MKKGRHRRFEEARALKRGPDIDIESILDQPDPWGPPASPAEQPEEEEDYDPDHWTNPELTDD